MEPKPYPEEKRRILIERCSSDFITFLEQITDSNGKQFVREKLSPQRKGFRKGRRPLKQSVPNLITELSRERELTNSKSTIWNKFRDAWIYWIKSHSRLHNILLEFDNSADFENDECRTPPNSELDLQCFKTLLKANCNNQIDQETIRRFYEYGYFNKDDKIEDLIDKALPQEVIENKQRLEELPCEIDQLSDTVTDLNSRISDIESANQVEPKLAQQIAETREFFETQLQNFSEQISVLERSSETQLPRIEFNSTQLTNLLRRLSKLNKSVKSFETKLPLVNRAEVQSIETRLDAMDELIAEIHAMTEEQQQTTRVPQIAHQALKIGKRYATLRDGKEHYSDENDYFSNFKDYLQIFKVTDADEIAAAIHVALKAFPALEIADTRIIKVWQLISGNSLYTTTIGVEMGWLGLQDWFPGLFAEECFEERLERADLDISIRKMLEIGNMPWAIHFSNCDMSFPESYLPRFLDWIGKFGKSGIRAFLTRCSGTNRCDPSEDIYARVARLPKPHVLEPIAARNFPPSEIVTRLTEWRSWCCPNSDSFANGSPDLRQLHVAIQDSGVKIPKELLQEISHYLQLSHKILAPTKSLDWALTLRLLPWIGNRQELIDTVHNWIHHADFELPHFQEGLQEAREADE